MSPEPEQAPAPRQKSGATKMMAVAGLVALVTAALGIGSRIRTKNHLRDEAVAASVPTVTVFVPEQSSGAQELTLPGSVEAFTEAPIHARASGYVKKFYVDLGARVKKGQRLADIEAPEVDQQLSQARAQLGTAQANEDLAKITWDRLQKLVDTDGQPFADAALQWLISFRWIEGEAVRQLYDGGDPHITGAPLRSPDLHRMHPGALRQFLLGQFAALPLRPDVATDHDLRLHPSIIRSRADSVQSQ